MGFNFPAPPSDMVMPQTTQAVATSIMLALSLAFVVYALTERRRTGTYVALLLVLGGAIASVNEAIVDSTGLVWHPRIDDWMAYNSFAPVPLWVVGAYCTFEGGFAYLLYKRVKAGMTRAQVWKAFGLLVAANWVLEIPLLALDFYDYYGNPPLEVAGYPIYWPFLNLPPILVTVALLVRLPALFEGRKVALLLVEPAMAYAAVSNAVGWPIFTALHSPGMAEPFRWALCVLGIALSCLIVDALSRVLASKPDAGPDGGRPGREPAEDPVAMPRPEPARQTVTVARGNA